jgi:hypothetical protein
LALAIARPPRPAAREVLRDARGVIDEPHDHADAAQPERGAGEQRACRLVRRVREPPPEPDEREREHGEPAERERGRRKQAPGVTELAVERHPHGSRESARRAREPESLPQRAQHRQRVAEEGRALRVRLEHEVKQHELAEDREAERARGRASQQSRDRHDGRLIT